MVSVVQSVWPLNKYRALLPDLVFPRRGCGMWLSLFYGLSELDDFMTLLCLRDIDGGRVQTLPATMACKNTAVDVQGGAGTES